MDIEDIIQYENESSSIDFKAIQYTKVKYNELLKDVIAMANAETEGTKLIIFGVKMLTDGRREIIGLKENVIDSASFQQLIHHNVEPEIYFSYSPFQFDDKTLSILKLSDCNDKPYMMKKDFGEKLKKGDCFIRKGTFTERLVRKDLDKIFAKRYENSKFKGTIDCTFSSSQTKILKINTRNNKELPSKVARKKIEKIIREKEEKIKTNPGYALIFNQDIPTIGGIPYENRSISTLKENLENLSETYIKDDLYYLTNDLAQKINFRLINKSDEFLQNVTIEIFIKKCQGFIVCKKIYPKPISRNIFTLPIPTSLSYDELNYGQVNEEIKGYRIISEIGNLKHNLPQEALTVPLRMCFDSILKGKKIEVNIFLHARNLKKPIEYFLEIMCL